MARTFDPASTQYLELASNVAGFPQTYSAWGKPNSALLTTVILCAANSADVTTRRDIGFAGTVGGDPGYCEEQQTGFGAANTSSAFSTTTWQNLTGVFATSTDRKVYLAGGNSGSDATNLTPVGMNRTAVGRYSGSVPGAYYSGDAAEVAVFSVALSARQVVAARNAVAPLVSLALTYYWPLWPGYTGQGLIRGTNLTNNGTTDARHCPVFARHVGGG